MSEITAIVRGTTRNFAAFRDFADRVCGFVDAHEPETLIYRFFADEHTGVFVCQETYLDGAAFVTHTQNMDEQGFREEAAQLADVQEVTILGVVADPAAAELLEQSSAVQLPPVAAADR